MNPDAPRSLDEQASVAAVPRLCIGLPVYNGERFLEETLESILDQTFTDYEVVVADNASTDGTQLIVERFAAKDSRIRYVRHERNLGASANFDFVRQLCRSEYFKWFAADDTCSPRFLEACIDVLEAHPEVGLVYAPAACINAESRVGYAFADVAEMPDHWSPQAARRMRQAFRALLTDGSVANVMVFGVIRSDVLDRVTPIGHYFGADLPFVAELVGAGGVVELPETMYFLRRHDRSSSTYDRTPSAAAQQDFYDPSVRGWFRLRLNLRRRYLALLGVAATAPVGLLERVGLVAALLISVVRRLVWRVRFEIDSRRGEMSPDPTWPAGPVHWSEV